MSSDFNRALQFHKNGQFDQAELAYRQLLDEEPDHSGALHLLGVLAFQRGQLDRAIKLINRAVVLEPLAAIYHSNLAEAYRVAGNLNGAVAHAQEAVRLQPDLADAHNILGLALQGQGRLPDAVACFREALRLQPALALAHNNLGSALRQLGQHAEGELALREALRLQPQLALALSNLGQHLFEQGQMEEALVHCREAVRLQPDFPEGLSNLGNVLRAQGNLVEAKDCYRKALMLKPDLATAQSNLGQALQEESAIDEAIACYRRALELAPKTARIECFLAGALAEKDETEEALRHYRRVLDYQPDFPEAHNGLGFLLQEQGDSAAAIRCFEEALRLKPDMADAHANLGTACAELGELERAIACYRETLRFDPDHAGALAALATQLRKRLPEEDLAAMQRLLARDRLSDSKRASLQYGLAEVYEARGDYPAAAEHAREANQRRRNVWTRLGKGYNRADHSRFVTSMQKEVTPAFFERVRGWGLATETPVFIVGMPRSGTTLLEQILASHPQVYGAGELGITRDEFDSLPTLLGSDQTPAECLPLLTRPIVRQLGEMHLAQLRKRHATAARIVDKMPDNYLWLGFLAALFPRAKFIYSKRDLRDVAVSCWITNFIAIRWACNLDDLAARIQDHQRLMEHWRRVLPVPLMEVAYEDTVADLEAVARRLIAFCGLEWDPACLAFHETKRPVRTASVTQVRQPIYATSVQRWKRYEEALAPLFRTLNESGES